MNKIRKILITFVLILSVVLTNAKAAEFKDTAGNRSIFDINFIKTEDVEGDLYAFCNDLYVNSKVEGNIGAIGIKEANVNADARNVFVASGGESLYKGNAKSIYCIGTNVSVEANAKSTFIIGRSVSLAGKFEGDVSIVGTNVKLDKNLIVTGRLNIKCPVEPTYPESIDDTKVRYEVLTQKEKKIEEVKEKNELVRILAYLIWLIPSTLLLTIIYIKLLSPLKRKSIEILKREPVKVFTVGVLIFIFAPLTSLVFMIAIVGLQVAAVAVLVYLLCILLALPNAGIALGELIMKNTNKVISGMIGTLVVTAMAMAPYLGVLVWIICISYTFGTMGIMLFEKNKKEHEQS